MDIIDSRSQSEANPWKGGAKPAYDLSDELRRQEGDLNSLTDYCVPLFYQVFRVRDGLDREKLTKDILEKLPHGADGKGKPKLVEMVADELRVEISNIFPQLSTLNGKEWQRLTANLVFFEVIEKPDGKKKEKRRILGQMFASAAWFAKLFQPVSPNEFLEAILKEIIASEEASETQWKKWVAAQPPPPPPPASIADVAAIVAREVSAALKSART